MEKEFTDFLEDYYSRIDSLSKKANLSYFDASISGKETDYEASSKYQLEICKTYSNKSDFEKLKRFKNSGEIKDQILKRQLDLIYNEYASNQFDEKLHEEIISLSTNIEKKYSLFRAELNEKKITDNEIDKILEKSCNSEELKETWMASKQIGKFVEEDVLQLVKLRNRGAKELGYNNYHEMSLALNEQKSNKIDELFDELDEMTKASFTKLKIQIDTHLLEKYNIDKESVMPWHYQDKYFQVGPKIFTIDLDKYFEDKDIEKITRDYFNGIELNIDDVLDKSDLYEKEGKYQHAYCTDIDRRGDVRVLCNIKPNHRWMSTMLHEFGHAVYDKFISHTLPWQLRTHAHILTTEAIAMMFGRFALNPQWLKDMIGFSENEKEKISEDCFKSLQSEQLIFSRWIQVMYHFEKGMYENPGQNLNNFWWELVERYQLLKKPEGRDEPDWAAKIHLALYPAYYHNYMLGELLALQLYYYIAKKVIKSSKSDECFSGNDKVGEYLKQLFFSYGALFPWDELIVKATGEKLSPKYYANQFIN